MRNASMIALAKITIGCVASGEAGQCSQVHLSFDLIGLHPFFYRAFQWFFFGRKGLLPQKNEKWRPPLFLFGCERGKERSTIAVIATR